jgi:hypothetical protein
MGFFDSMKKGFEEESQKLGELRARNSHRNPREREKEFKNQSDSVLLREMNSPHTSDADKIIIDGILKGRGYTKTANGTYDRR